MQSGLRDGWNKSGEGFRYAIRSEAERARCAFICDMAVGIDDVQAIGPAGVGALSGVVERVHHGRELHPEIADAHLSQITALVKTLRTGKHDVVFHIAGHLPHVAGVRFLDVYDVERHLVFVLVVQRVQRGNLPAEWRSSIAAKYQHNRFLTFQRRKLKVVLMVG